MFDLRLMETLLREPTLSIEEAARWVRLTADRRPGDDPGYPARRPAPKPTPEPVAA